MPRSHALGRWELLADGAVHVGGVSAVLVGAFLLIALAVQTGTPATLIAAVVYCFGAAAMFGCSAAYSLFDWCRHGGLLRRFDHAAIFAMIAGSYTPFTLLKIGHHGWSIGITIAVWATAAIGIGFKLAWAMRSWVASIAFYLALGWLPLVAVIPLITAVEPVTLVMLLVGGVLYTIGVAFFAWKRLPFRRAIWHGFVLVAACFQYAAVASVVGGDSSG